MRQKQALLCLVHKSLAIAQGSLERASAQAQQPPGASEALGPAEALTAQARAVLLAFQTLSLAQKVQVWAQSMHLALQARAAPMQLQWARHPTGVQVRVRSKRPKWLQIDEAWRFGT